MNDKINFSVPDEVVTQVITKIQEAITLMTPYLIALTPEERQTIPKMSDKTLPFVEKCIDYATSNPEFAPTYLDKPGLSADMAVFKKLTPLSRLVQQLNSNLNDTITEAGGEAYTASLSYYSSIKQAAKMSVPGSKPIFEDLSKRFVKTKTAAPETVVS